VVSPAPKLCCIDCGAPSPTLDEGMTLRSTLGWRLMREKLADGTIVPVWRCPQCWEKHKERKGP
jgi:hypothetical protein